jgi:hypothetical protein
VLCKKHCFNRHNGRNDWRKLLAKLYPPKRAKKQHSVTAQSIWPLGQHTDSNTVVLQRQAPGPSALHGARSGTYSDKAKVAITWVAVTDGVRAGVSLYDRLFAAPHPDMIHMQPQHNPRFWFTEITPMHRFAKETAFEEAMY